MVTSLTHTQREKVRSPDILPKIMMPPFGRPLAEGLAQQSHIVARISDLFSVKNPPYRLNGGAALNLLAFPSMKRIPSDIDIRCDDLRSCRESFSRRFRMVGKIAPVAMYCFVDENGIQMDLTQNRLDEEKKAYQGTGLLSNVGEILSYSVETLIAEKFMALTRKRDIKDLYDAYYCLALHFDMQRLRHLLLGIGNMDNLDPADIAKPSFVLDGGLGGNMHVASDFNPFELLKKVQQFVGNLLQKS